METTSKQPIKPSPLRKGDQISLVAPAYYLEDKRVSCCVKTLSSKGFKVKLASNIGMKDGEFAGSDKARAQGLMECFLDSNIKAVWCLRGGYGSGRILPYLDFEVIRKQPKIFIGMSDITILHTALNKLCHLGTFLGPNAGDLFGCFEDQSTLFAQENAWKVLQKDQDSSKKWSYTSSSMKVVKGGKGQGLLVGGNLSVIGAQIGTPWQIDTNDKIIVLEAFDEYRYRIDRLLNQLKQAKLFENCKGILFGSWTNCGRKTAKHWEIPKILEDFFSDAPFPVINGFPTGHIVNQVTLPLNCMAKLDADQKCVTLLENCLQT